MLTEIDLSQNNLNLTAIKQLKLWINNSDCRLVTLKLCECNLSGLRALETIKGLIKNSSVEHLDMSRNDFGFEKTRRAMGSNWIGAIKTLNLNHCNLTD